MEALDGFEIQEELENARYTYDLGSSTIEIEYFDTRDEVFGISRPKQAGVTLGWFARPTGPTTFQIESAAVDLDQDGDFFDESRLSVGSESRGEFLADGDQLELVLVVTASGVEFSETGNLIATETI